MIEEHTIDESFFLYMEETDHQQLLQRHGWRVVIEPAAVVWQSSGGVPPYYQTRNIQLFQQKNGSRLQRIASAPYIIAHSIVGDVIKRRGMSRWRQLIAGWRAGASLRRGPSIDPVPAIAILNPLGGALSHYTDALATLLRASGTHVDVHSIDEPSISGHGRLQWLLSYLRLLNKAGRLRRGDQTSETLVTWPVLGFLDLILVRALCGKSAAIVYHDPKPLVRSVGNGPFAARLVAGVPSKPRVVVHSKAAADAMHHVGLASELDILAHPMLPPARRDVQPNAREGRRPVVRVLGQFKQDRDLAVLLALASEFSSVFDLEIVGVLASGRGMESRFTIRHRTRT